MRDVERRLMRLEQTDRPTGEPEVWMDLQDGRFRGPNGMVLSAEELDVRQPPEGMRIFRILIARPAS